MAEFIPISQVKKMRSGINAKAEVKSKGDPRTVNLKSGGTVDVCDAIIADGETEEDQLEKLVEAGENFQRELDISMTIKEVLKDLKELYLFAYRRQKVVYIYCCLLSLHI